MNILFNYDLITEACNQNKIVVIDSLPGSGKTTFITKYLHEKKLNNVLYVTPFLSESESELPRNKLAGLHYTFPKSGQGGKTYNLQTLIRNGCTMSGSRLHRITCTHSAFTRLQPEIYDQLGEYTIIIDETLDIISPIEELGIYTEYLLLGRGTIKEETKRFHFHDCDWFHSLKEKEVKKYNYIGNNKKDDFYHLCHWATCEQLYRYSEGNWFRILNVDLLKKAKNVIILTHGFEYSFMHCWLKMNDMPNLTIDTNALGLIDERALKNQLKANINMIQAPKIFRSLSEVRGKEILSKSHWHELNESKRINEIGKSINTLLKKSMNAKRDNIIWTAPKQYKPLLQKSASRLNGTIVTKQKIELIDSEFLDFDELEVHSSTKQSTWLPCNIKATNSYGHITNCLYAFSVNPQPDVLNLLSKCSGLSKSNMINTFKLNNLLQFIYRGSIRNNVKMNLCILPEDTKQLLLNYLS